MSLIRPEDWSSPQLAIGLADKWYGKLPAVTPAAPTTGSTVATVDANGLPITCLRLNPAGAITGVILGVGQFDGQPLQIRNVSAFSITFAAVGTSHVADGVAAVLAALTVYEFVWDATASFWLHSGL